MTGIMAAREQRILSALRSGLETSAQIGAAIGESPRVVAVYLNMMAGRRMVIKGARIIQPSGAHGAGCIRWRACEATQ